MAPRNEEFPDYKGISVEHADGWDYLEYHNRTAKPIEPAKKPRVKPQGLGNAGRQTNLYDHQKRLLENEAQKDWRNRGLTNNKIIDN